MARGVLIIEDEEILAKNVKKFLERNGYDAVMAHTAADGLRIFEKADVDVVLLDINLPDRHGLEVLAALRERNANAVVICVTGHGDVQIAVDAMKAGAADFVTKPVALGELKALIDKALGQQKLVTAVRHYAAAGGDDGASRLIGDSPQMQRLRDQIKSIANVERTQVEGPPAPVLIRGETGTGKELIARALHLEGPRRDAPFIELNCATLPAQLLESELFGHERGAFTDARERKLGLVEAADGGTLFLDEVGDLELPLQTKILKLLEDRTVRRVGGLRDRVVDVRFVSATNRPLEEWVKSGQYRSDLYYRLRVLTVEAPPLRDRQGDVRMLAESFLASHAARYGKKGMRFTAAAMARLEAHGWPGNVRELKNTIEQAVLTARGGAIEPDDLAIITRMDVVTPVVAQAGIGPVGESATTSLGELERGAIENALDRCGGNVTRAARLLGISRDTLRYRIEKYGLK